LDIISSNINPFFQFGKCRLAFKVSSIKRVRAKDSRFVWEACNPMVTNPFNFKNKKKTLFKLDCNLIIHDTLSIILGTMQNL
jgi:hypothetical protein